MTENRDIDWLRTGFRALDLIYFADALQDQGVRIKWARWRAPRGASEGRPRWGCYRVSEKMIEISPVLKLAVVPDYFVLEVIHHEMLHGHIGVDHNATFLLCEQRFVHHTAARVFELENLDMLYALRPPGTKKS